MALEPVRVACVGIGWWSDVLADAIQRSNKLKIVSCYTRSEEKRRAFAAKYGCREAAASGKHVFLDKPIANSVSEGREITTVCREAGIVLALGYQRRRETHFR